MFGRSVVFLSTAMSNMVLFGICGLILIFTSKVTALCNTCSAKTGLACVAVNKFKICDGGIPVGDPIKCPEGKICSPSSMICTSDDNVAKSCSECGVCNTAKVFACTGYRTFAFCNGGDIPSDVNYVCKDNMVCNKDSPKICVEIETTGLGATCPWTPPETTTFVPTTTPLQTPSPLYETDQYCSYINEVGRFPIYSATECTKYVSCVVSEDNWSGSLYNCPAGTYFDIVNQACDKDASPSCPMPD